MMPGNGRQHPAARSSVINSLKVSEYFKPGLSPIVVFNNEHHGRSSLHKHEFYEMVFISRGVALHSYENATQILTTGDFFIILPGEAHSYISTHETSLFNCLFTNGALEGLKDDIASLDELNWLLTGGDRDSFEKVHARPAECQAIQSDLQQLIWEQLNQPAGWQLKCKSLLVSLLVTYARLSTNHRLMDHDSGTNFRKILKAVSYIEQNYRTELPVETLASEAGLSVSFFSRQFKAFLDTSPSEYARNFRIAKAAELLRRDNLSVAEIARELGYGDITLFSRQFRQVTGITPTGFRKNKKDD
jgi:AraC family transcriptional regulator, L-rhamnose operon transcriptional activator RhaR